MSTAAAEPTQRLSRGRGQRRKPVAKDIPSSPGGPSTTTKTESETPPTADKTETSTDKTPSYKPPTSPPAKKTEEKKKKKVSGKAKKTPSASTQSAQDPDKETAKEKKKETDKREKKIVNQVKKLLETQKKEKDRIKSTFGQDFCDAPWNVENSTGYDPDWWLKSDPAEVARLQELEEDKRKIEEMRTESTAHLFKKAAQLDLNK